MTMTDSMTMSETSWDDSPKGKFFGTMTRFQERDCPSFLFLPVLTVLYRIDTGTITVPVGQIRTSLTK